MTDIEIIVPVLTEEEINEFISYNPNCYNYSFVLPKGLEIEVKNPQHLYINQKDKGIYDAINTAIKFSKKNYYIVLGSDDRILGNKLFEIDTSFLDQINVFPVLIGDRVWRKKGIISTDAHKSLISEHSAGIIFSKSVHDYVGYYNISYTISGDADLILNCSKKNLNFKYFNEILCSYSGTGVSSRSYIKGQNELLEIMKFHFPRKYIIFLFIQKLRVIWKKLRS